MVVRKVSWPEIKSEAKRQLDDLVDKYEELTPLKEAIGQRVEDANPNLQLLFGLFNQYFDYIKQTRFDYAKGLLMYVLRGVESEMDGKERDAAARLRDKEAAWDYLERVQGTLKVQKPELRDETVISGIKGVCDAVASLKQALEPAAIKIERYKIPQPVVLIAQKQILSDLTSEYYDNRDRPISWAAELNIFDIAFGKEKLEVLLEKDFRTGEPYNPWYDAGKLAVAAVIS